MKFNAFPVVRYLLCLIAGILAYLQTHYFNTVFYYTGAGLLLILLTSIFFRSPLFRGISACLLLFLSGWVLAYQKTVINNPEHFTNQKNFSYYQAIITSNAEIKAKTYKVEAEIRQVRTSEKWQKATGKILLYFNKAEAKKPQYGDIFLIKNMPSEIDPPKNPEEFDYRQFLRNKGIYGHHFLWQNEYLKIGHQVPATILKIAYQANLYADSVFKAHLKTVNEYAITNAMVVGTRDDIDDELLSAYSASGAIHVLSVSGMHVGILFLVLSTLLKSIKTRIKYGNWVFTIIVLLLLWTYAVFTGLSSTVLRATVMFSFIQIGTTINRRHNIYNILAVSALVLLWYNPYWLAEVGFQLSYLAILGIVYLYPYLNQLINPTNPIVRVLWEGTVVCFAAQLFTAPLSIYYFHQFPTYFLIANPFVAFFSFWILPAGLLLLIFSWVPVVSTFVAVILKCSCYLLNETIFAIEKLPLSTLKGFSISIPELLAWYAIIILVIAFFRHSELKYLRVSAVFFIGLALVNVYEDYQQSRQKQLTFHFLPKQTGISVIDGKSVAFIADSGVINNRKLYNFHLKNYYDKRGVSNLNLLNLDAHTNKQGMMFLDFEGKKIIWLQKPFKGTLQGNADYVLLSNNAIRNLASSFGSFQNELIIIDDSNKSYLIEKLKRQADSLRLNLIALRDTGAYSIIGN
ncbi:ComEC/Rec2 family competence protein [Emticicia sp. BO119]|uniref:ComEC/Rec2 family competence protein n=1 Tax=Emticicia sp. BO119 TaxID=2757768 RepID=UPI0015F0208B|nr:ComEC/Rec2 family competence protein [Emticicia sp. BO119]MBA4851554.1 ComEC family competence protein [Emticicia sp. BO119]